MRMDGGHHVRTPAKPRLTHVTCHAVKTLGAGLLPASLAAR
jgi:hypothetical protein